MLFFTWVINLMKFIGKNVVLCTCLILGEIHALSRPQQAGYAASSSLTWPVIDVSWPVWPCLGPSLGPTCGHPDSNYGHQGLHFESRSAKRHRKTWIGLHILLVATLSQITGILSPRCRHDGFKVVYGGREWPATLSGGD